MVRQDTQLAALKRHDKYYIPGGDLFFLVENYHFRVHRYFFERESKFFQAHLASPAAPGETPKGDSESSALVFDNLKIVDFDRFLWVFYNPKYSLYDAKVEDWTSILELAHRWGFGEVKGLAIRELEKITMTEVDRIVLYHKYEIDRKILIPRYASLCAREWGLTTNEGNKLGIDTALMISRARECARCKTTDSGARTPLPADFKPDDMNSLITDLFGLQDPPTPTPPNAQNQQASGSKQDASGRGSKLDLTAKHNKQTDGAGSSGGGKNKDKKKTNGLDGGGTDPTATT